MAVSLLIRVGDLWDVVLMVFTPSIDPPRREFNDSRIIKKLIPYAGYSSSASRKRE